MGIKPLQRSSTRDASPVDTLFSATQQRVLGALYGQPSRSFYATELITASGGGSGAVQRELARLEASGLVVTKRIGVQKHYQANPRSPIFEALAALIYRLGIGTTATEERATGIAEQAAGYVVRRSRHVRRSEILRRLGVSRQRLAAFCDDHGIAKLSLFGSVTRDDFRPDSDVDVMVQFARGSKPDLFGMSEVKDGLSALFGGRAVDVITDAAIRNPVRKRSIARDLETVYAAQ